MPATDYQGSSFTSIGRSILSINRREQVHAMDAGGAHGGHDLTSSHGHELIQGHLFASEKRRGASENDEDVSVKETVTTAQVETKGEEEEQTKAQVHPTRDAEIAGTVESNEL